MSAARNRHPALAQDFVNVFTDTMEALPPALKFEAVMGGHPKPYWWRLYIDPRHWNHALKIADPGHLYDEQESPGFQAAMTAAYDTFLVSTGPRATALHDALGSSGKPMTWQLYQDMWKIAVPSPTGVQEGTEPDKVEPVAFQSYLEQDKTGNWFGCPQQLVDDLAAETLTVDGEKWHLVAEEHSAEAKRAFSLNMRNKDDGSWQLKPQYAGPILQKGVDAVFTRFAKDIHSASTQGGLLRAIAQAVRALHVMHTFSDGCGRVNVFMLLPAMMLRYGFGVPLGRQLFGRELSYGALYALFNGDYSVGTIAQLLHLTQDRGLLAPKESILSLSIPQHSSSQSSTSVPTPGPGNAGTKTPTPRPGERGLEPVSASEDPDPGPKKPAVHPRPVPEDSALKSGEATGDTRSPKPHVGVSTQKPASNTHPTTHGILAQTAGRASSSHTDASHEEASTHKPVVRFASVTSASPVTRPSERAPPAAAPLTSITHQTSNLVLF